MSNKTTPKKPSIFIRNLTDEQLRDINFAMEYCIKKGHITQYTRTQTLLYLAKRFATHIQEKEAIEAQQK